MATATTSSGQAAVLLRIAGPIVAAGIFFAAGAAWQKTRADHHGNVGPPALSASNPSPSTSSRPAPETRTAPSRWPAELLPPAGEFDKQAAVILSGHELVPHHPEVFRSVVAALHRHVRVICMISMPEEQVIAAALLEQAKVPADRVVFVRVPLDSMWVRDYGPFFLKRADGSVLLADLDYTPPGDEHQFRWRDNGVPRALGEVLRLPVLAAPLRLGGGGLITNGRGLFVTTSGVIHENNDRGYDPARVHSLLERHLGCKTWLCLQPLVGEPTSHIDTFITFVAPDMAVVGQCDPSEDTANADVLNHAARELSRQQTPLGPMHVQRIPMPPKADGRWRSYTNIILANEVVLVPTFSDVDQAMQQEALDVYRRLLPARQIIPINADSLATNDGLLHCISLQVPAFVRVALDGVSQGM